MCSFCNQHIISGTVCAPSPEEVKQICRNAYNEVNDRQNSEIAFFGGSFTAVPEDYRNKLLSSVQEFIGDDGFKGIRISTRPDCINDQILTDLKKYHVTAIELGCQSMSDEVLVLNERGHDSQCIRKSSELIRSYGFELGLQMMTGLYGSSPDTDIYTAKEIIRIRPDTVRIYPVVILKGTKLAELYQEGKYKVYGLDKMVTLCSQIMSMFESNNIVIIKCGLHSSESVSEDMVSGYYHPAFRELCESRMFRINLQDHLQKYGKGQFTVAVSNRFISKAVGQKRSNIEYFSLAGVNLNIISDASLSDKEFIIYNLQKEVVDVFKIT